MSHWFSKKENGYKLIHPCHSVVVTQEALQQDWVTWNSWLGTGRTPRYSWHFLIQKMCVCSLLYFSIYESPIIVLRTNWYCSSSEYAMQVSPTNLAVGLSFKAQSNQWDSVIPDLKQCSKKRLALGIETQHWNGKEPLGYCGWRGQRCVMLWLWITNTS